MRGEYQRNRRSAWLSLLAGDEASSLVEFAVSLPLLIVLVVGIFDFGGAFNLKQELANAAREGARFGASQPTNDLLNGGTPPSVNAIRGLVDSYLKAAGVNDCGLNGAPASVAASLAWTYTTNSPANGCAGTMVLTIARGPSSASVTNSTTSCNFSVSNYGGIAVYIPCTEVTISYPYQWHFNTVIKLLVPSAVYSAVSQIQTSSYASNVN